MTVQELCEGIGLQEEIQREVEAFCQSFDFGTVKGYLDQLKRADGEREAREQLKQRFKEDGRQIKMLSCMLVCAADLFEWYQENGIPETIFYDTMKCFPRFIEECRAIDGSYAFDREWWTSRQVGGRLFRIGQLEFEMKRSEDHPVISIHIPSDADFSEETCDGSIEAAMKFFEEHFPEFSDVDYICNSWLLAPALRGLLPEESNILNFQGRFIIKEVDDTDTEYLEWVYQVRNCGIEFLPENTSLQKNMKQYLLNGGKIGSATGVMSRRPADGAA